MMNLQVLLYEFPVQNTLLTISTAKGKKIYVNVENKELETKLENGKAKLTKEV